MKISKDNPLLGKRVLVTRTEAQAIELVGLLSSLGAIPILAPTIQIVGPSNPEPLENVCASIDNFDWIIFTSSNGVKFFMKQYVKINGENARLPAQICAIGPSTAKCLKSFNVDSDFIPEEHRAEAVLAGLQKKDNLTGKYILLPRGDLANKMLPTELRKCGALVTDLTCYRTLLADHADASGEDVYRNLHKQGIDIVTFTSASTVKNFVKILGKPSALDFLNSTCVASIGPVTAKAAAELGIRTTITPIKYTIPSLVDAILSHYTGNKT